GARRTVFMEDAQRAESDVVDRSDCQRRTVMLGPVTLEGVSYGSAARFHASQENFLFMFPRAGQSVSRHEDETLTCATESGGVVLAPGTSYWHAIDAGFQSLTVSIDRGFLEGHLRALTGAPSRDPVSFPPVVHIECGAGLWRLIDFLADDLKDDD